MNRIALALTGALSAAVLAGCGGADADSAATPFQAPAELAAASSQALVQANKGLDSATADVQRVAPRLEQYYFVKGYPSDLEGAKESMKESRQTLAKGNKLGGYSFDQEDREFILCVQNKSGAWATYDTAPMATGANGESGGCPKDLRAGHTGH